MSRTRWGVEIPRDPSDARAEGRQARSYDRNPYDNFGVSRAEEEAHDAWDRGRRSREDERMAERLREEEEAACQDEHDAEQES